MKRNDDGNWSIAVNSYHHQAVADRRTDAESHGDGHGRYHGKPYTGRNPDSCGRCSGIRPRYQRRCAQPCHLPSSSMRHGDNPLLPAFRCWPHLLRYTDEQQIHALRGRFPWTMRSPRHHRRHFRFLRSRSIGSPRGWKDITRRSWWIASARMTTSSAFDHEDRMDHGASRLRCYQASSRTTARRSPIFRGLHHAVTDDSLVRLLPGSERLLRDLKAAGYGVWGLTNWSYETIHLLL